MSQAIRLADLVVCANRALREDLRLGLDVGLYLQDRRRDGLVYFAGPDRSLWLSKSSLMVVDPADPRVVPPPAWVATLHEVFALLDGMDLDIERGETDAWVARVSCPGLDPPLLARLTALIGPAAPTLRIRPGSMSRVLVEYLAHRLSGPNTPS